MSKNKITLEDLTSGTFVLLNNNTTSIAEVPIGIVIFAYYNEDYFIDKALVVVLGDLDNSDEHCREYVVTKENINKLVKKVYPDEANYDSILKQF